MATEPRPRSSILARSVTQNAAGQFASLAVGFFASVVLARVLGPSARGLLALMLSFSSVVLLLTGLGIPVAASYHASRRDTSPSGLLGNSIVYAAVLAAVLIPLAWLLHAPIADLLGRGRGGETWVLAAALVPITFLDWAVHNQLVGSLRFGRYNVLVVLSKVAYLVGVAVLLGVLGLGVAAGILATAAGSVIVIAGALPPLLRFGPPRVDRALFGKVIRYGTRVQVGAIFQLANARLDVFVLQFLRPLSEVGYYVVAQMIAELVVALALAFRTSVLPLISHYEGDERQGTTTTAIVRNYAVVATVATIANAIFGTAVILWAYGPSFHAAVLPMLVILPGIFFFGLGSVIGGDLGGRGRPGLSSALAGCAALVTVALDLALIPPFGVMGAAVASVIAYTTFGGASLVALSRVSEIPLAEMVPRRADVARYRLALRELRVRVRAATGRAS